MTRAVLISPSSVPGGAERALASLARRLPSAGVEVQAVLLQPGPLEDWLADAGCPVEVVDAGRTRHLHRTASTVARLARRAAQADVVISNQSKGHVYGGLAAAIARRPAIWWQHGTPARSAIESVAARMPAAAVAVGSGQSADAQRRLTPHRRVELVHPGVDVEAVQRRAGSGLVLRNDHGWEGKRLVGIVGRLQEWKGQDVFLRAAALVADAHPDVVFPVVGGALLGWEGDYPQQLRRLADELGISDRVHFAGHQEDVYPWFDAMDVVVHASHGEPFGLVLVEAMALGKPLVATAAGGPTEIIEDGVSGLLVPPGDHEAMAGAIAAVLDDAALQASLGAGAAGRARAFDEQRMADRFATLIGDVVARGDEQLSGGEPMLEERTVPGLHDHVYRHVVPLPGGGGRALDLGAGSGAFATRLRAGGYDVLAVDRSDGAAGAGVPFAAADLDTIDWWRPLGEGQWDLVTAIEVIEHLESPIGFLRGVSRLLAARGVAVLTTPNVDSLPARAKLLLRDRIRMLDEHGDPTHISPIFWDLLVRQYLPRVGLRLVDSSTYPPDGFVVGRPAYRRVMTLAKPLLARSPRLLGDNHVLVLQRVGAVSGSGQA